MRDMEERVGLASALRRGTLEFCVLAMLESEPRYGVELVGRLAADGTLTTSEGTLYPLLSRLRRAGWVTTTWEESRTGPPRRYYGLTDSGKAALTNFRSEWVVFRDAVDRTVGTERT
jgi:PadR family transcriptional regulator PadR